MATNSYVGRLDKAVFLHAWLRQAFLVIGSSIFIAIFAHIAIPLPFTPVPLVLQGSICLFLGIVLGSKRAALAVLLFLLQGSCGLPVFANGSGGGAYLLGPTGGYLLGYCVGAFVTGYIWERLRTKTEARAFLAMMAGNMVIYLLGVTHLGQFIGGERAFYLGVAPFIVSDLLKLFLNVRALKLTPLAKLEVVWV